MEKRLMLRNSYSCTVHANSRNHTLACMNGVYLIFHRDGILVPMVASPHQTPQVPPMLSPSELNIFFKLTRINKTHYSLTTITKQKPNTKRQSCKTRIVKNLHKT